MNKINLVLFALAFCLSSATTFASSEFTFKEGQQFHRAKAKSPVYLRYSNKIRVNEQTLEGAIEEDFTGFIIHSFKTKKPVGYITALFKPTSPMIYLTFIRILEVEQRKGFCTSALMTLPGIFKKYANHFPKNLFLLFFCANDNIGMNKAAKKTGFKVTDKFPQKFMTTYLKYASDKSSVATDNKSEKKV